MTHGAGVAAGGSGASPRPAGLRVVKALIAALAPALLLVGMAALSAGCADDQPPDMTMAALGAAVGDAKLDDLDFSLLLATYTSESYRTGVQPEQSNFQLYLAAKAADMGLNKAGSGNIEVTADVGGESADFRFVFERKEGLFAVADVGSIDIVLVRTDASRYPWRIEAITLAR